MEEAGEQRVERQPSPFLHPPPPIPGNNGFLAQQSALTMFLTMDPPPQQSALAIFPTVGPPSQQSALTTFPIVDPPSQQSAVSMVPIVDPLSPGTSASLAQQSALVPHVVCISKKVSLINCLHVCYCMHLSRDSTLFSAQCVSNCMRLSCSNVVLSTCGNGERLGVGAGGGQFLRVHFKASLTTPSLPRSNRSPADQWLF